MMDHVHLGRTGTLVSQLCLGTMNFGQLMYRARLPRHPRHGA